MNYIELINRFWRLDESHDFTPSETRLYFYLLKVANSLQWPEQFDIKDSKLCGISGLTANTLKPARTRLVYAGLLSLDLSAPGLRDGTTYWILENSKGPGKVSEKASKKASTKQSAKASKNDSLNDEDSENSQPNNQGNNQQKNQFLTLSYINIDNKPKTETLNKILFVAYRDCVSVRACWFWLIKNKKPPKPPQVPRSPPKSEKPKESPSIVTRLKQEVERLMPGYEWGAKEGAAAKELAAKLKRRIESKRENKQESITDDEIVDSFLKLVSYTQNLTAYFHFTTIPKLNSHYNEIIAQSTNRANGNGKITSAKNTSIQSNPHGAGSSIPAATTHRANGFGRRSSRTNKELVG